MTDITPATSPALAAENATLPPELETVVYAALEEIGDGHPEQQRAECRSLIGHAMLNPSLHNYHEVMRVFALLAVLVDTWPEGENP